MTIAFLGDSITLGYALEDRSARYSTLVAAELGMDEENYGITGTLVAKAGLNESDGLDFVSRLHLIERADVAIIFGGTNDSWANSPLGEETFTDYSHKNLFNVMPALSFIIKRAKEILPEANIVFIVNDSLKPEIASTVISASEHFGTSYALLEGIDKTNGHPTVKGMKNIKDQLSAFITKHTEK